VAELAPIFVALGELELHFPGARSLKDKRQDLRSSIERLKGRFGVLVIESDHQDLHQRAGVALAAMATEPDAARGMVSRALDYLHQTFPGVVLDERVNVVQVR
jgi:uncharacterized protein